MVDRSSVFSLARLCMICVHCVRVVLASSLARCPHTSHPYIYTRLVCVRDPRPGYGSTRAVTAIALRSSFLSPPSALIRKMDPDKESWSEKFIDTP